MGLDIRWPIGLLCVIFGVLLSGFGAISDPSLYQRSLGVNVNLWWGAVILVFGVVMLAFGIRGTRRQPGSGPAADGRPRA